MDSVLEVLGECWEVEVMVVEAMALVAMGLVAEEDLALVA